MKYNKELVNTYGQGKLENLLSPKQILEDSFSLFLIGAVREILIVIFSHFDILNAEPHQS
ncbi:hypothetical protein [Lentibacillus salicampi]|uniref:Uncharacterized protein n=1 Tax=Lentibacillus salicampi TaxID=175306 RepID=A0A4Y9AET8_9BACI|nr:hypothetical protein [Lentibacillus salicampi]TFJ94343.1 hypothetical protein E4U82_00015 [Lentibacillus salicampi]